MESISIIGFLVLGSHDHLVRQIAEIWVHVKTLLVVPFLNISLYICLAMSIMLFIDIFYMAFVIGFKIVFRKKADKRYKFESFKVDIESGNSTYPLVLIQVPMFNEKEVYQLSIGAACRLSWPSNRIVIQVLDDSTDLVIKGMVKEECRKWASTGINIHYQVRDNRKGYKAGALKEGLKHEYANVCEYVAIFDADFQPEPDFLSQTIPFLHHNSEIGLVQARWNFVNSNECLMTRMQEMSLNYHFKVEQESGSSTYEFFSFNGSAGVWRMAALEDAGGWKDRTTVEDMDLAVRASLKGWKFLYLGSVKVKSELPSSYKAYRYQQHRWSCGPANLFRKTVYEIIRNENVTLWKKLYLIYSFFFVRKIVAHFVAFVFYCVVLPMCMIVPEVYIPSWGLVYIPIIIALLNAVGTPRSFYLLVFWILFENVMSLHRTKGTFIGLFEGEGVNEWVVTEKHGDASKHKPTSRFRFGERFLILELGVGLFLFICGCLDLAFGEYRYYIFLYLQAFAFLTMGCSYIGINVPVS